MSRMHTIATREAKALINDAIGKAGCGYDDYSDGTVADRLRACAASPGHGSDGDYTADERQLFRDAAEAWDAIQA